MVKRVGQPVRSEYRRHCGQRISWLLGLALLLACGLRLQNVARAAEPAFEVTLSTKIRREPFSGRVYVLTGRGKKEPRTGLSWFQPQPFLARDVVNWPPGRPVSLSPADDEVLTFPRDLTSVDLSGTQVQAVARLNPLERQVGTGAGNGFSAVATLTESDGPLSLEIDQLVPERPFAETEWTKLLVVRSTLLSDFHDRDVFLRAAVTLPAGYSEHPQRRYPTIFVVPGFGGTHRLGRRTKPVDEDNEQGVEFLRVTLDPSCPLGHHVFADSANNGPVGRALIDELIPDFDRQFRSIADPAARFVNGHSSGGWSSLWLQVTYPETFGGVWSTAPDPVDFRDFQRIDLYAPKVNMYVDEQGNRRPLAIQRGRVALWYDDFDRMEHVLGPGGQLHSFEAVFSPRGDDGRPLRVWDRETGEVDSAVVRCWEPYDIRLVLERHWDTLEPRLAGKLHVFMGSVDTFLLDGATRRLQETLRQLGSNAVVEIHEGRDHRTLLSRKLRDRIRSEMTTQFLTAFSDWPDVTADAPAR